ncbi:MerR family transcriptional regulator [Paenibacillus tritici]|uniref:MerR family transcriptional regulator n=1 Tax=Paenibacillus tritici TaxID=1873425 RepID=UPI001BA55233|nr:MerR family transcriptional regulator [Paenibacillus tritici]QUL54881.1 MerR family transcriptional regulator [Paenibacillus tritici]
MEILKTKEAAELLSVSQTTIKRWAAMFPDFFLKDRLGHYTFSEQQISQLTHIKDRINHGEALECIQLDQADDKLPAGLLQENPGLHSEGDLMNRIWTRIEDIEHALDQKASEIVSVQLLQQRAELEDMRVMIKQLSASLETMHKPVTTSRSPYEELHPVAAGRLMSPPRKRSLLRSFFPFL